MGVITEFKTQIKADVYGLSKFLGKSDFYGEPSNVDIDWSVEIEMRNWGVKAIDVNIIKVSGSLYWTRTNENDDLEDGEIDFCSDDKWKIKCEIEPSASGVICPNGVEIDFNDMEITVSQTNRIC